MRVTTRGITAGVAAIAMTGFAVMAIAQQNDDPAQQQRQRQQQQQTGERGGTDALWNEAAELHRRIVRMEISQQQASPGQQTPGQPGAREGAQRDGARNQPGQAAQRDSEQPGQPGERRSPFTAGQSRSDALWNQLAEKHEQLVQMKLREGQASGAQRTTPERGEADQERDEAGQERGTQREQPGHQIASATDQLEKEIGQLYIQILEADVADARGAREVLRPDLNDQNPARRPGQRTPERNPNN